jgi:hypothetical protein
MASWESLETQRKIHYTQMAEAPPDSPIYRECQTYRRELPRLLAEGLEGNVVLIKGEEIIGFFADEDEAVRVGRQKYLMQPFLVQRIREWEPLLFQGGLFRTCLISPSR